MARNQDTGGPAAADARKFYVKSYGCQMNVYDAQRMADTLAREGMIATDTPGIPPSERDQLMELIALAQALRH